LACIPGRRSLPLGQHAAGHYVLNGRVDVHLLLDPAPDSTISYFTRVEFDVPRCDTTVTPCMVPFLVGGALRLGGSCELEVDPGHTGSLTLSAIPTEPLGGIQGRIECTPPFRIVHASAPEGMSFLHVSSVPDGRGIRYLVFTDPGTAIPPPKGPVMQLAIAADAGATPGAHGQLFPLITLASSVDGDS